MIYLLIVSLIWAFSFGLIKGNLVGIDSNFVAFVRLLIPFFIFLPFLKIKDVKLKLISSLLLIGSIQYGIMYVSYVYAFQFLKAYEIVLFTIFTPIYVVLINDFLEKKIHPFLYITAIISLIGTAIVVWNEITSAELLIGFLLMQVSNISFAFGQIFYKRTMTRFAEIKDMNIFAILFLGGFLTAFLFSLFTTDYSSLVLTTSEMLTLIYLGAIASGVGFFLWNYGAKLTNTGSLAIFNNLKIPLGIIISILFFSEKANIWNLLIGGLIVASALVINEYRIKKHSSLTEDK